MKKPSQSLLAVALAAAATLAVAQQPGTNIPNTTHPTNEARAAGAYLDRSALDAPVASLATGAGGHDGEAARGLVEALNSDASLRGSKLTVVPEKGGLLVTGVTPSLRQKAHIVNMASQQAGDASVRHSISTEEVVIDVGTLATAPESMIPPDQIQVEGAGQSSQEAGDMQQAQGTEQAQGTQQATQQTADAQQAAQGSQAAAQAQDSAQAQPGTGQQPMTAQAPQSQPQQQPALQAQLEAAYAQLEAAKAQLEAVEAQLQSSAAKGSSR